MLRRLFTLASALSLVLCGATLAMWLTARKLDRVRLTTRWTDQTRQVKLSVDAIGWDRDAMRHGHWEFDWNIDKLDPAGAQLDPVRQDLRHAFGPPEQTVRKWSDRLPQWRAAHPTMVMWSRSATADQISFRMAALVFGLLPTAWVIGWGRRYWRNAAERTTGCCPICGYDLRATPDRCPECGHVPERVTA